MNKTIIRHSRPRVVTRSKVNKINKHQVHLPRILHASNNDIVTTSYFVGKTITLFTFFYTSLNWMMYKNINKDQGDEDVENKNENDQQ
jgi:helix-turn-helix protein